MMVMHMYEICVVRERATWGQEVLPPADSSSMVPAHLLAKALPLQILLEDEALGCGKFARWERSRHLDHSPTWQLEGRMVGSAAVPCHASKTPIHQASFNIHPTALIEDPLARKLRSDESCPIISLMKQFVCLWELAVPWGVAVEE
eukprot:CAMPEP_0181169410 /NCGR_PEP_ID=MMETSP1096-20121128/800_1 /TAXON_ID=156174 ORGANISM="Chrysochromulina ericina, Strain CCMP281" /NCGR_SAMPLE_ID=MMETSP1096 /ASSEMBLY_ACC=CAM_ASM_000453 /LENGTH=145 /DNA_ID=CAMNT_0023256867 /DNA_START=275 /DNA_END=710 /DNA_ORIENTATION=+